MKKIVLCLSLLWGNFASASTSNINLLEHYGVEFNCSNQEIKEIKKSTSDLISELNLSKFIEIKESDGKLDFFVSKKYAVGSNLTIDHNPIFNIEKETKSIPARDGTIETKVTSKKEILLALLYPGRLTKFNTQSACQPNSLLEHVELRQNIVLWGQNLDWGWPNGDYAYWNKKYWDDGTPILKNDNKTEDLVVAVRDMFINQQLYAIGCYTASKAVYLQAIIDYYARVNPNKEKLQLIVDKLLTDGEPFVDIEPPSMWYFEKEYNKKDKNKNGKLLTIINYVEPGNFVPGDWSYFRNTDNKTNKKIGYEGSNAIYLGGDLFDDYYNDHEHGYPYERKLEEVYQWRNGVFSRGRDANKIEIIDAKKRFQLTLPVKAGGIVESYRVVPIIF